MPSSRSAVRCGSWFAYARNGSEKLSRQLCDLIIFIKPDRLDPRSQRPFAELVAARIATDRLRLPGCFDAGALLVPVPRSSLLQDGSVWPARSICDGLVRHHLARTWAPLLVRRTHITKSAGSTNRPDADQHYETLAVEPSLLEAPPTRILLVDDVVGRGCTLLASAWRLRHAFPDCDVLAFALARAQQRGEAAAAPDPVMEWLQSAGPGQCQRTDGPPLFP